LSGGLALCAAHAYVRFAGLGIDGGKENPSRWRFYILALAFFQLAMFAKTAVSFLPLTLFLIVWWQREKISWRDMAPLLPMLAISALMGKLTIFMEHKYAGATGAGFNLDLAQRILISGHSFWFYLGKLFFPYPLVEIYERWKIISVSWLQFIYPAATLATLVGLWIARGRIGKGAFAAAMHFYISTSMFVLMVVIFFMRYSFVSDHWQYFGCMSVFGVTAAGITMALARFGKLKLFFCCALLLLLGNLTWQQAEIYRSAETLWRANIAQNPDAFVAQNDLGFVLLASGRVDESLFHLQKAVQLQPDDASSQKNLGSALLQKGRVDEAIVHFQEVVKSHPDDASARNNLGYAFFRKGLVAEAIVQYDKALELQPHDAGVHHNFGIALFKEGLVDEAMAHYRKALEIQPDNAEVENDLGSALNRKGQVAEAIRHWQHALELRPQYMPAQNNLAWALATNPDASLRNGAKAVDLAQQANQSTGGKNLLILRTLAAAYAEAGQFTNALATAGQALQLAVNEHNMPMINSFQVQIKLYENDQPLHASAD
jgi:Flp pilus assembly protein TadD